ncbi:tetratricopeptide repeat protein [Phenylobacterium sp.]|uniref:tetratricopeptide repeat-containing glycosyltransferase family protein n=1 Tax=Phenylobacterium sp. TaxID=1871053 RepID=UPI0025CE596F|nr:tetratricopeptide repeat protein [Phenylobacterium sp.]
MSPSDPESPQAGPQRDVVGEAMFQRALALHKAGDTGKAESLYRVVLDNAPHDHETANNLGWLLYNTDRPDEALPCFQWALDLGVAPDPPRVGVARCHMALSAFDKAEPLLREAIARQPDEAELRLSLGYALLGLGRFTEGWPLYDGLRPDPAKAVGRGFPAPEWQGEPLAGKRLFIWREQGFGDQLMLARFLPMLGAAKVTYAGPPALERLFRQMPVDYLPVTGPWDAGPHDYWTLPFSLPLRFGVTPETLPQGPYFTGTPTRRGGVGVMWRGNALPHPERSLSEAAGAELLALPGAISLDPADTGAGDFQATADLIAGLDLVITIDTSVAHLAGAMGKPVWILLPARHADWRWMQGRATSPWYPSARLYRQAIPNDWAPVVAQVKRDLTAL